MLFFQVYSIDGGWGTKQSDGHFNGIVGFIILRYIDISFHKNLDGDDRKVRS